jgi:NhaA family Na+:H+ antiporter
MATRPPPDDSSATPPPESWPAAVALARRVMTPVDRFLSIEAGSGVLLLVAAAVALAWANSPWHDSYEALWHTPIGFTLGAFTFERDLHFWVNDGLMTIFFFVVGLEIRREIHQGELSELRRAALPLVAAVGGMLAPAAIYAALNRGQPSIVGWGVPMATDIAFAVGVLALLGRRVSPALRIFLLALAVIDDLGAILVIAIFYSEGLNLGGLGVAGVGLAVLLGMQKLGVRRTLAYLPPAVVIWAGAYQAGVHPTLAGVVVGLLTPVRAWYGLSRFFDRASAALEKARPHVGVAMPSPDFLHHLAALERAHREALSPLERLQHALHGFVAYGIMPAFALANAGVPLGAASLDGTGALVFTGIAAGLALGKPIGIVGLSWVGARLGLVVLPTGVRWPGIMVVGLVGGIGFTMALFVGGLAFPAGANLETAKLGILSASLLAAVGGLTLGRLVLREALDPGAARTNAEAERSSAV